MRQDKDTGKQHLYRHFNAAGVLLYVGVSISAIQRLGQHKENAHWYSTISRVEIEQYNTRAEVLEAERLAIINEKPLHNIALNKPVKPSKQKQEMPPAVADKPKAPPGYAWVSIPNDVVRGMVAIVGGSKITNISGVQVLRKVAA